MRERERQIKEHLSIGVCVCVRERERQIKEHLSIPVISNGNVVTHHDALRPGGGGRGGGGGEVF